MAIALRAGLRLLSGGGRLGRVRNLLDGVNVSASGIGRQGLNIGLSHNISDVMRDLERAQSQVKFATSLAINDVAQAVQREGELALRNRIDRPTPFTLRAFAVLRSSKGRLEAVVFAKDAQAAYLKYLEEGGERLPRGRAIPIPAALTRNQFGNMRRGAVKRLLAHPHVFSGKPRGRGRAGLYRRVGATPKKPGGKGLRLEVSWEKRARYKPSLGFVPRARQVAADRFPLALRAAFARALGSRKR